MSTSEQQTDAQPRRCPRCNHPYQTNNPAEACPECPVLLPPQQTERERLYQAAVAADEAWSTEGRRIFGKRWGDVRYTPAAHGEPGSRLRALFEAYRAAGD